MPVRMVFLFMAERSFPFLLAAAVRRGTGRVPTRRHTGLRQLIGFAAGAIQILVGLGVVGKDFLHGVPLQFSAGPAGDVAQVADRGRAMADLDVGDRALRLLMQSIQFSICRVCRLAASF